MCPVFKKQEFHINLSAYNFYSVNDNDTLRVNR